MTLAIVYLKPDAEAEASAELAEIVANVVEGCEIEILGEAGADQRTYKADFSKFARTFPDFRFKWNAESGVRDLARRVAESYYASREALGFPMLNATEEAAHG